MSTSVLALALIMLIGCTMLPNVTAGTDAGSGPVDAALAPPFVPHAVTAELLFSGPARVKTPASWNAHLPKLAGDDHFLYAVHTHFPDEVSGRFAAILRRPRAGGTFTEVARISFPHQPPGMVMDRDLQLHLIFDCLRPDQTDVTCFQGGAGTAGLDSRFYHLRFSARDGQSALRFDTYANENEWTALSNGYLGLGTTPSGTTVWSLADASWGRVVQYRSRDGAIGTLTTLTRPSVYLLYPITAALPATAADGLVLFMGEFDPAGGTNAGYPASVAYIGDTGGLRELIQRTPTLPVAPGAVGAYPSDVAFDERGTLYLLSYRVDGSRCTELLRFDAGTSHAPTILPVGCEEDYAKIQFSRSGTLYLLAAGGKDAAFRLGISTDRGASFSFTDLPIPSLPATGDTRFFGITPIKPYSSPGIYDPDRLVFLFAGADGSGLSRHSYLGQVRLSP